jgi:hypothetical protein
VLEHLPSVPSVVLPIKSPAEKAGLSSFKPLLKAFGVYDRVSFILADSAERSMTCIGQTDLSVKRAISLPDK